MYSSFIKFYLPVALAALLASSNAVSSKFEKKPLNLGSGISVLISDTSLPLSSLTSLPISIPSSASSVTTSSIIPSDPSPTTTSSSSSSIAPETSSSSSDTASSSSLVPSSSSSSSETSTSVSFTSFPQSTVLVVVTTDGSIYTSSSTAFSSSALPTQSGSVSSDQSSGGSSSGPNKNTIIGATVGIGGAIIVAGLAFVAWRLWGKNRKHGDEDEILMNGSSAHGEKLSNSTNSPFKSTLDQYHAHSGTNF